MVYLLERKSEAFEAIKNYITMAENKFETKVHKSSCDNGGEYTSKELQK